MSIRSLSTRLARIEAQRDNRTYQAAWDAACQQLGWTPIDVGDARCIEDLLMALHDPATSESPALPIGTGFNP